LPGQNGFFSTGRRNDKTESGPKQTKKLAAASKRRILCARLYLNSQAREVIL